MIVVREFAFEAAPIIAWAERIRAWVAGREPRNAERAAPPTKPRASGRDVYIYFDNDAKVRAPFDAMSLAEKLGAAPQVEAA